jgi:hypothetical protein
MKAPGQGWAGVGRVTKAKLYQKGKTFPALKILRKLKQFF